MPINGYPSLTIGTNLPPPENEAVRTDARFVNIVRRFKNQPWTQIRLGHHVRLPLGQNYIHAKILSYYRGMFLVCLFLLFPFLRMNLEHETRQREETARALRLHHAAEEPLELRALHPVRCALHDARHDVERTTNADRNRHAKLAEMFEEMGL